jgi:sulfatase modifying factor 1
MLCVLAATSLAAHEADAAGRKSRKSSAVATTRSRASSSAPSRPSSGSEKVGKAKSGKSAKPTRAKSSRGAKKKVASVERRRPREVEEEREPQRPRAGVLAPLARVIHCPSDMVAVAGRVCVDRFELRLVDGASGAAWSPFYPPDLGRAQTIAAFYEDLRDKESAPWLGALLPIPQLPQRQGALRASSEGGVVPQGHLTADQAEGTCRASGKRLCSESEWLTACRGEDNTDFPYGAKYQAGACNVYRESHPSWLLHGNAARYHDDPRNNLVATDEGSLLRPTGATARCASRWGDDAIYDMVGNLDEWTSDASGVFAGGFYSRPNKSGCYARVSNHPRAYSDYSTGARCCADPPADG